MKKNRHHDSQVAFGLKLREIRKSKGITQQTLSYMADVDISTLNRIELGKAGTSLSNVFAICEALDIEPKELFDFQVKKKKS